MSVKPRGTYFFNNDDNNCAYSLTFPKFALSSSRIKQSFLKNFEGLLRTPCLSCDHLVMSLQRYLIVDKRSNKIERVLK